MIAATRNTAPKRSQGHGDLPQRKLAHQNTLCLTPVNSSSGGVSGCERPGREGRRAIATKGVLWSAKPDRGQEMGEIANIALVHLVIQDAIPTDRGCPGRSRSDFIQRGPPSDEDPASIQLAFNHAPDHDIRLCSDLRELTGCDTAATTSPRVIAPCLDLDPPESRDNISPSRDGSRKLSLAAIPFCTSADEQATSPTLPTLCDLGVFAYCSRPPRLYALR